MTHSFNRERRRYTSSDLLLPFPLNYLIIGLGVFKAKKYMKQHGGNDTFKTRLWSAVTINEIINKKESQLTGLHNFHWLKSLNPSQLSENNYLTYRHYISIKNFFQMIGNA